METEEQLNEQLADILVKIDKTKRELKALRGHPMEGQGESQDPASSQIRNG